MIATHVEDGRMTDARYWIALSMIPDIGPVTARRLIAAFGTPERVFGASIRELLEIDTVGMRRARSIRDFSAWHDVEKQLERLERGDVTVTAIQSPSYPELLREIDDAPIVLYTRGKLIPKDRYSISIVGSRKPTPYGISVAESITEELARMGFTVVSGMARGIDSLAHRAALRRGGRTLAVLGSGIDIPYPPENKTLMEHIASSGCLISEFPPGTPPEKENFPKRNRIISGLSLGVLVVEATADSGSLITARSAMEQGREVFAIPGTVTSAHSTGTHVLIRQGARLVRHARDIVEELAPVLKGFMKSDAETTQDLSEEEKRVCSFLSGEPKQIDDISRECGLPTAKMLGILLGLEMKGAVRQMTGKRFYLA